ncbi:helix-turn-helix domain-containing protein [Polaribacter sp. BAL334]|uniref:helix-turn-helix domain-containing protein n=1 Tax=Polaribacter sp. BAL334 TaxID=1708178 RepID=UPI0018D20933|nr:helix-turn-helix domain-containing protein [Polaribacter sp. BAL334]MBG7610905.1 helix-turn-helix domain-containing protein [Polaribacter sp. BAL334]
MSKKSKLNTLEMANCKKIYFFIVIYFFISSHVTTLGQTQNDTLRNKSLEELFNLYSNSSLKNEQIKYINAFVYVAKKKNIKKRVLSGYQILSSLYDDEKKLLYLDSVINLSKNAPLKNYPTVAYNTKAIYYHGKGDYKNALENYLQSNKFAEIEKNDQLIFLNTYSIGTIKRKIGEFDEALLLYRFCLSYSKKDLSKNSYTYLLTLLAMSNVFYELKEVDSAKYYNRLGVKESLKQQDIEKYHHFSANQGIIHFIEKRYETALDSLSKHTPYFEKNKDSMNLAYIYFHLGKLYDSKANKKEAVKYHKKIDSLFNPNSKYTKEFRESYEYLISYYKEENNLKKQLFYIDKLMYFDSILNATESYLSNKMFKEYDIPKLKKEKALIQSEMENSKVRLKSIITLFTCIVLGLLFLLYHQFNKRKKYKKRFLQILNNNDQNDCDTKGNLDKNKIDVPENIVNDILAKLDEFEKSKKFTSNKITLNSLAKKLDTNTNYLSKVINHYKNTSFSNYINNLKIEYIISEIKVNPLLRKFTLHALAKEAGFNNTESFSKAFFKLKGIKPSYFMKELEKRN